MSKKFNIDGSLQVTEKIVVQGDLEVKGSTTTVNQETLTVKDNLIAVNGTGASLDTVQKVGLIAITGAAQYTLNNGFYDINSEALMNLLGAETYVDETAPWASMLGPYRVRFSNTDNINRLAKLKPVQIMAKANGNMLNCTSGLQISTQTQYQPNGAISIDTNEFPDSWICSCTFDTEGNITGISESSYLLIFNNQIVAPEDVEFIKQFLIIDDGSGPVTDANFSSSQQAYAAPIYDKTDDTLKIGSGSFTRDANGNVDSFTFGAGEAQAIATRADGISDKALVAWDAVNNRLIENPYPYIGQTQYSTDIGDIWSALNSKISKSSSVLNMAYGKGSDGNDKEWHIVPFPTGTPQMDAALTNSQILCTVPLGVGESAPDLNGTLIVPEPTAAYEVANKKYVDDAVSGKLDTKADEWNGAAGGYATLRYRLHTNSGENTGTLKVYNKPLNSAIPQFSTSGTLKTNTPTENLDCVNKEYLESVLANAGSGGNYYEKVDGINIGDNFVKGIISSNGIFTSDSLSTGLYGDELWLKDKAGTSPNKVYASISYDGTNDKLKYTGNPSVANHNLATEEYVDSMVAENIGKGEQGEPGKNGVIFTPQVSADGTLSWTNDGGLENPEPINIVGNVESIGEIVQTTGDSETAVMSQKATTNAIAQSMDKANTKVTLTVTSGQRLDLRGIYNLANHGGCTEVNWGDGIATKIQGLTDDEMKHDYTIAGTYTVILVGVKDLTKALFREKNVKSVEIGSTVEQIHDYTFDGNPDLTEVMIYAETPPITYTTLSNLIHNPFGNSPIEKIYVHNSSYLTDSNWSVFVDKIYADYLQGEINIPEEVQAQIDKNTNDIAMLMASGGASGSVDTSKTIFTVEITDGALYLDFRSVWNYCVGATHVDWGDDNENDITIDDHLKHTYATAGTYKISVTGITEIKNTAFREKGYISKVVIGDIVTSIGKYAFNGCTALTEVTFNSITPPEFMAQTSAGDIAPYNTFSMDYVKKMYIPKGTLFAYRKAYTWVIKDSLGKVTGERSYENVLDSGEYDTALFVDKTVTVGTNGDFETLNEAIDYLSFYYPTYKKHGVKCEIKILAGTVINEQISANQIDLQYITIVAEAGENNTETITIDGTAYTIVIVDVDASGFGVKPEIAHDARGNLPFITGQNAAKLPTIGCVFRLIPNTSPEGKPVCGLLCNRGSECVVLAASGFDGFNDGCIANNESSITIREGISRNMTRWGVHARHNGEVSARSCICTNCGVGAYADRVADLDVREAVLDGSIIAIECRNLSRANANGCHANNCGADDGYVVVVGEGGFANCISLETNNTKGTLYNFETNTYTRNGVIFV